MSNIFEQEISRSLRAVGAFVYKFPDGKYAARPGDHSVMWRGRGYIIEEKMVDTPTFPLSGWTAAQRAHCAEVEASGGAYWLVVNWRTLAGQPRTGLACAFRGRTLLANLGVRGSLSPGSGIQLLRTTGGWDVRPLLEAP